MKVVGYCLVGHHVRYVEVTQVALDESRVSGVVKGVCDSCKREQEGGKMGWWSQDEQGHSFASAESGEMLWGDSCADILDHAIDEIIEEFKASHDRRPSRAELLAGMKFSLGGDRIRES